MDKYDVGLYGLWYGNNYGSQITYYALCSILQEKGYTVAMVFNPLDDPNIDWKTLPEQSPQKFGLRNNYAILPWCDITEMSKLNSYCNSFVLGSDQMWNYDLSLPYRFTYFLDFVKGAQKISYATSMGKSEYFAPEDYKNVVKECLSQFDAISVREQFSKELLKKEMNIDSKVVIDPVFLCSKEELDKISVNPDSGEGYIFAYILDPSPEIGRALELAIDKYNKKIYVAFDLEGDIEWQINELATNSDGIVYVGKITTEQWLGYYKYADCIITDSFHGTCFSIIYKHDFYSLKNGNRGGGRFDEIVRMTGIKSRVAENVDDLVQMIQSESLPILNWDEIYSKIDAQKKDSLEWLIAKLGNPLINCKNVNRLNRNSCIGCGSCVSICPVNAIRLVEDEHGFFRRNVDSDKCIQCGKCANACPALELPKNNNSLKPDCYAVQVTDKIVLEDSSSGGIFYYFAKNILDNNGKVYGAAWTDGLKVEHISISSLHDLKRLQKSKYVQSFVGDIFKSVKKDLEKGQQVLFSGTPCQVAGLKKFLNRDYENLFLLDIFCTNAPSQYFFRKYLEDDCKDGVKEYEFRTKKNGVNWSCESVLIKNGEGQSELRQGPGDDGYQRAFHCHLMCSYHCEHCKYQKLPRHGDISLGDFWGIENKHIGIDTTKGVSACLVNNEKGKKLLDNIKSTDIFCQKVELEWLGGNGGLFGDNWASPHRDVFFNEIIRKPFNEAVNSALNPYYNIIRNEPNHALINFDSMFSIFDFDHNYWSENIKDGEIVLSTNNASSPFGKYASVFLGQVLKKGEEYILELEYRLKTQSKIVNFHVKDSVSRACQIIYQERLDENEEVGFKKVEIRFRCNSDFYDQFMVGAAQFTGDDSYIIFRRIHLKKICFL